MIDSGAVQVIIDVREEYQGYQTGTFVEPSGYCYAGAPQPPPGHIPEALHYPWMSGYLGDHFRELPTGRAILTVCHTGGRSGLAAQFLCANGYGPVYNMSGGMLAWTNETEQCCYAQADCDDGLFCNGQETCNGLACLPAGSGPCDQPYVGCSEELNQCFDCPGDYDCDNATDGADNCPQLANGPLMGTCVVMVSGVPVGTGAECLDGIECASGICQKAQEDYNANGTGDACECYADVSSVVGMPDGRVDVFDLLAVKVEYSLPPIKADINADGRVDAFDLLVMRRQYGKSSCQ